MVANIGLPRPDHPNRGWHLWLVSTIMVIVAGIFVGVRLIARYLRGGLQADDWTILVALIVCIILTITENLAVVNGYGRHQWDLTDEEIHSALRWFYGAQIAYKMVIGLAKMSILFLYLRIFYVEKRFRWACYALLTLTISTTIAFTLATIWQCDPIRAFWNRKIEGSKCVDSLPFWLSFSIINIITDVLILILPMQQVLRLKLKKRDKIALNLVFVLGAFVCVTSIIRATTLASSSSSKDSTWSPIPATVWSVVECNTGIICACMPMIRQPLSVLFPRLFSRTEQSHSKPYANSGFQSRRNTRLLNANVSNASQHQAPWAHQNLDDDRFLMTSVTPGNHADRSRNDSQEQMICSDGTSPNGIIKRTDVSISSNTT